MKVIFVGQLPPPLHGVSILNKSVLEHLKRDNQVLEIPIGGSSNLKDMTQGSKTGKLASFISQYTHLIFSSIRFRPELAYFTPNMKGPALYRDLLIALALKLTSKKTVLHLHGLGIKENCSHPLKRAIYNLILKKTTIICVSETVCKSEFSNFIPSQSHITFASNSIDFEEIQRESEKVPKSSQKTLVHMANFRESKGTMDVLNSFLSLKKKHPNIKLTMIGSFTSDAFEKKCMEFIRDNKLLGVTITGHLDGASKIRALAEGHIFVYPTYDDSFGLVIIEAMACGLPVVAYNVGSVPELIDNGRNGYIIQPGDTSRLETTLDAMISSPKGVDSDENAIKEKIRDRYNLKDYPERVVRAFNHS